MAWDARRPVPWKRLGTFLGLYAGVMILVAVFSERDRIASALFSVIIGVVVASAFLIVLVKFGWTLPMLRSKQEIAEQRAQRAATRAARRGGGGSGEEPVGGPRPKPAPTSRTTTGPSQHRKKSGAKRR